MNDEFENKELSDLLKQLPAPERLDAARRARIFAVLPSAKEDAQEVKRETRRRIWHRVVKVAAIVVLMVGVVVGIPSLLKSVIVSVQYKKASPLVDQEMRMYSMVSPAESSDWPIYRGDRYSDGPLESPVDDPPASLYVALESDGYASGAVAPSPIAPVPAAAPAGSMGDHDKDGNPFSKAQVALNEMLMQGARASEPMSPKPAEMKTVAIVKSPIVMRGIVGTPSAGQRATRSGGAKANPQAGEKSKHKPMKMLQVAPQSEVAAEAPKADASDRLEAEQLRERRLAEVEKKRGISVNDSEVADIKNRLDKANEHYVSGELAQSRKEAELVLRDYPAYEDGVDMLRKVSIAENKYVDNERVVNREQMMRDVTKDGIQDASRPIQPRGEEVIEEEMVVEQMEEAKEPEPPPSPLAIGPFTLIPTAEHPLSTFGLDTDTAGYTRSAMLIASGVRPDPGQIRQEEFINAFEYGDTAPTEAAFRIYLEGARSPFRSANNLLRVGVKGRRLGREEKRSLMLTILLDTSGSMETPERMPLARKAILALLAKLPEGDSVTILTCSDKTRKLFSGSAWDNPETLRTAEKRVTEIRCQGATNLEDGIVKAFESAASEFKPHGENRVVIISDGIANLGSNNASEILKKVAENRGRGIRCSVIGVGRSSYNDTLLEAMANRGDGQYSFLDSEQSIDESFVSDLENSFNTIASDVKIQVEWNRDVVEAYKSHGYDSRALRDEQFRDDTVDAGEVGSGQGVTVVYEMKLADSATSTAVLGTVRIRYRRTDNGVVEEIKKAITLADVMREFSTSRPQFRLACAVAEFATVLKHTPAAAQASALKDVVTIADVVAWNLDYYQPAKAFAETVKRLMALGL